MVRDAYVVKNQLYFCAESLIQIEMCNDSVDKSFFFLFLKAEKRFTLRRRIPKKNIHLLYVIWYETKKKKWQNRFCISTEGIKLLK